MFGVSALMVVSAILTEQNKLNGMTKEQLDRYREECREKSRIKERKIEAPDSSNLPLWLALAFGIGIFLG